MITLGMYVSEARCEAISSFSSDIAFEVKLIYIDMLVWNLIH